MKGLIIPTGHLFRKFNFSQEPLSLLLITRRVFGSLSGLVQIRIFLLRLVQNRIILSRLVFFVLFLRRRLLLVVISDSGFLFWHRSLADRLSLRLRRSNLLFSHHNFAFFRIRFFFRTFFGFFRFRFFVEFFLHEMFQLALCTGRTESLQEIWKPKTWIVTLFHFK